MSHKSLFGLISFVIILAWLVSPIAAFAQDVTPTDPPADVPTETLPATDVPAEVTPEVLPTDVLPTDVAPVETVVPTEVIVTVPEPAVSLVDVTNALVDTAATVSTGDPSGFLNATAAAAVSAKLLSPIGAGTPFNYYYTPNEGGAPPDGTCMIDGPAVTCYWVTPVQQAIRDAAPTTYVTIEAGATFNENVIIGFDPFNLTTICSPSSCPAGILGLLSGSSPVINGFVIINNVNDFDLANLTINVYLAIYSSQSVQVHNVVVSPPVDGDVPASSSPRLDITNSTDVGVYDSTIYKAGFNNAVGISNSSDVTLGSDTIYSTGANWGINAYSVNDLSIYNSEIYADNGALGGIQVTDSNGSLLIGGDGTEVGAFAPVKGC